MQGFILVVWLINCRCHQIFSFYYSFFSTSSMNQHFASLNKSFALFSLFYISFNFFSSLIETRVREGSLKEVDVPMIFKICPTPGFRQEGLQAAGYKGVKDFFDGTVEIRNMSVLGWAGNSTSMKEFLKSVTYSVEDIIQKVIVLNTENEQSEIDLEKIHVRKVNYPSNCFTLDLSKEPLLNESAIKTLRINFYNKEAVSTEVQLVGKNIFTERNINRLSIFSSGDRILTKNGSLSSYFVSIRVEEDFTLNCTSYPNKPYEDYTQCDNG